MSLLGCAIAIALSRAADLHGTVLVLLSAQPCSSRPHFSPSNPVARPAPAGRPAQAQLLTPCVVLLSAQPCSSRRSAQDRPLTLCVILLSAAALKRCHHPALRRRSQASPSPCSPLPCLSSLVSSSAGRCLSVAPCRYQVPHVDLHLFHCCQIIFPAPISTWPSLSPRRHPLRSLSPLSRRGCPGNPESTLS